MLQAKCLTFTLTWLGLQMVTGNADYFLRRNHGTREIKDSSNIQEPKRFGYSVQGNGHQASHFRKEERDENGVVRGSYGLQDQDGTFRLVRYIADEKGFRADITSNEPGVGQQSPASVHVNRFANSQMKNKETDFSETYKSNQNYPEHQDWQSDQEFFSRNKPTFEDQSQSAGDSGPLDLRKYLVNYPFIDEGSLSSQEQPTSDVLWKDYNGNVYGKQNPSKLFGGDSGETTSNTHTKNDQPAWFRSDSMPKTKSADTRPSDMRDADYRNTPRMRPSVPNADQITPGVLDILLTKPQQKVHRNLPDCGTVYSNVLCKPPLVSSDNFLKQNTSGSEDQKNFFEDPKSFDSLMTSRQDSTRQIIETTFADRLYKFSEGEDEPSPFRTLRNNFAFQSDLFKYFPRMKEASKAKSSCSDKSLSHVDKSGDESLSSTPAYNRPVIYNSISNTHINSYGENWRNILSSTSDSANSPHHQLPQTLLVNGDNKYNVFNNERLLLLTPQSTQKELDSSVLQLLERLHVLGFILVPEKGIGQGKTKDTDSVKANVFTSGDSTYREESKNFANENNLNKNTQHIAQNNFRQIVETHKVIDSTSTRSPEHDINTFTSEIVDSHLSIPKSESSTNNSGFIILDDANKHEHGDSSEDEHENETEAPFNWRKILEDELNEEYKKNSFHVKSSTDTDSSEPISSENTGIPNERVFHINDPPLPLYDSRGVQINSENVPLHLHRYIPPTGVTSAPWKFAIPRPGPPRSIALPPHPSIAS